MRVNLNCSSLTHHIRLKQSEEAAEYRNVTSSSYLNPQTTFSITQHSRSVDNSCFNWSIKSRDVTW